MNLFELIKKSIKPILKWVHLILIMSFLLALSDHILEALIVIVLMYEIGFEIVALDRLIKYNNSFRRWILKKFSPKRKKK